MKQIYHFDSIRPPILSEKTLRDEMERRKVQKQTILLVLCGILMDWCLIMIGILLYPVSTFLTAVCIFHACIAIVGGLAVAVIFTTHKTRRKLT